MPSRWHPMLAAGVVLALAGPAAGSATPSTGFSGNPTTQVMAYYIDVRASFGFDSNPTAIGSILAEFGVGDEVGFPMTPDERKEFDRRSAVQTLLTEEMIQALEHSEGFGGMLFEHTPDGMSFVVLTTDNSKRDAILASVSSGLAPEIRIADHSWEDLVRMADLLAFENANSRIAIKTASNSIEVGIPTERHAAFAPVAAASQIPLSVVPYESSEPEETCSTRGWCWSPLRAGVGITQGGTLAFGISRNGDRQVCTSGHLTADPISHGGLGTIGYATATAYFNNGVDAKAVGAVDTQVSNRLFVTSSFYRSVTAYLTPVVGMAVYKSGVETDVTSGIVIDNYLRYNTSSRSNLKGASANYYSDSGDSGSPVYQATGSSTARAIGIHSTGSGDREFARMVDVLQELSAVLQTTP